MTRIDFYLLDASPTSTELAACRLAEEIWRAGQTVHIHTENAHSAQHLDELLWSFRADSFLPHSLLQESPAEQVALTPVHIGWGEEAGLHNDVLINLAATLPLFFSRFQHVAEIVPADETGRQQARERYRFYRDRGYPLATHTLQG